MFSRSRDVQSASLPGRPPLVSAPLRTVSRAFRAASRACDSDIAFRKTALPTSRWRSR